MTPAEDTTYFRCKLCGKAATMDDGTGYVCRECERYICTDCINEDAEPFAVCVECGELGLTPFDRHLALKR